MARNQLKKDKKDLKIEELTIDLQRLRADFENYRKNADEQKVAMKQYGAEEMLNKFLPVLDSIERAVKNTPVDLKENAWAQGVENLGKNLDKILAEVGVEKINATPGVVFNHEIHHAVAMDEATGDKEVIAEELQPGYKLNGAVLREAMVRVTKTSGQPSEEQPEVTAEEPEKLAS
jgi:molecular chaperone GrpE